MAYGNFLVFYKYSGCSLLKITTKKAVKRRLTKVSLTCAVNLLCGEHTASSCEEYVTQKKQHVFVMIVKLSLSK